MKPQEFFIGTSGFSFEDWKGIVYPQRLPQAQWLIYYEQELGFNSLEVNYTYYQMPAVRTMEGLLRKTTEAFRFTVKTHRSMTHDIVQKSLPISATSGCMGAMPRNGSAPHRRIATITSIPIRSFGRSSTAFGNSRTSLSGSTFSLTIAMPAAQPRTPSASKSC